MSDTILEARNIVRDYHLGGGLFSGRTAGRAAARVVA